MPEDFQASSVNLAKAQRQRTPSPVDCVEYSTISEEKWRESRNKGCLTKTANGKHRYYSRIKELTRPNEHIRRAVRKAVYSRTASEDEISKLQDKKRLAAKAASEGNLFGTVFFSPTLKSVGILEDLSAPPEYQTQDQVMLFTMEEFLSVLQSPDWCGDGRRMLRVLHGPILQRLQMALHALEARGQITINTSRAIMNNSYWSSTSSAQSENESDTRFERLKSISRHSTKRPEYTTEKILVDLFYYGKVKPAIDTSLEEPKISNIGTLAIKQPISHKVYLTGRLKLPKDEIYSPANKIEKLEAELKEIFVEKEKEKEVQQQKEGTGKKNDPKKKGQDDVEKLERVGGKGKSNENEFGGIDDIAEDPYLVPESKIDKVKESSKAAQITATESVKQVVSQDFKHVEGGMGSNVDVKNSQTLTHIPNIEPDSTIPNRLPSMLSITIDVESKRSSKKSTNVIESKQSVFIGKSETIDNLLKTELENAESGMIKTTEHDNEVGVDVVDSDIPSEESQIHLVDVSEPKTQLYLSGKELYVSAIYAEKDKNYESASVRLQKANKALLKSRAAATKQLYDDLYKSRTVDLATRFKSLAAARDNEKRKRARAEILNKPLNPPKYVTPDQKFKETRWDIYTNSHEDMEMRYAIHSRVYRDFMKRMNEKEKAHSHERESVFDKKMKMKPKKSVVNTNLNATPKLPPIEDETMESNTNSVYSLVGHFQHNLERNFETFGTESNSSNDLDLNNNQDDDQEKNTDLDGKKHDLKDKMYGKSKVVKDSHPQSTSYATRSNLSMKSTFQKPLKSKNQKLEVGEECKRVRFQTVGEKDNHGKSSPSPRQGRRKSCPSPTQARRKSSISNAVSTGNPVAIVRRETKRLLQNRILQQRKQMQQQNSILFVKNHTMGKYKRRSIEDHNLNSSLAPSEALSEKLTTIESTLKELNEVTDLEYDKPEVEIDGKKESVESVVLGPTESKLIEQALNEYNIACKCLECIDDEDEMYKQLLPKCKHYPFTYPIKLGCMKRSYKYISPVGQNSKTTPKDDIDVSDFHREITDECLREMLLCFMDKMIIRKDIIVSSLGKKLTTFVFISTVGCPSKPQE